MADLRNLMKNKMHFILKRRVLLLLVALCWVHPLLARDATQVQQTEEQLNPSVPEAERAGDKPQMSEFERALVNQVHSDLGYRLPAPTKPERSNLILWMFLFLAGAMALRKLAPELQVLLGTPLTAAGMATPAGVAPDYIEEDPSFAEFVASFRI